MREFPDVQPSSRSEWREWLTDNHDKSDGVWLVFFKKSTGKPTLTYDESVEEALCFGWIDSLPRKFDDERHRLLMTPRKPKSPWSRLNKTRVAALTEQGLIKAAGQAKIDLAKSDGSWTVYDAAEDLIEPSLLEESLNAQPIARSNWDAFPPSTRKGILWWIYSAKSEATQLKRIEETVRLAAQNIKANFPK